MDALLAAAAGLELEDNDARPLLEARDPGLRLRALSLPHPCIQAAKPSMLYCMQPPFRHANATVNKHIDMLQRMLNGGPHQAHWWRSATTYTPRYVPVTFEMRPGSSSPCVPA